MKKQKCSIQQLCPLSWLSQICQLVPIRGFVKGTDTFPIQKCAIFRKFKENGGIARRQTVVYAAQAIPPNDAEIAGKGHLWTETS
jgi:hypothetical protein